MNTEERKPLSVEELMQPRYKVIADYPNNPVKVTGIIEYLDSHGCFIADSFNTKKNGKYWFKGANDVKFKHFPAIFRKLEWWEEREEWMMPEYVKYVHSGEVLKPYKLDIKRGVVHESEMFSTNCPTLPSTREEYEIYLSKQNTK